MLKYILISFLIITNAYAYTCEEMGYTKSIADCPEGGLKCPAQPEKMFCCDPCGSGYRFNEKNCSPNDSLQLAGIQCGGKWTECRGCTSEYKYTKDNCRAPKILAGSQCANSYTGCVYPVGTGCIPTVGYIYYSDGSCHAWYDETDTQKEPIGIIIDASKKLIIALDEVKLPWNDGYPSNRPHIPELKSHPVTNDCSNNPTASLDLDGQKNTEIIMNFSKTSGIEHQAAGYCANKTEGNKKWFLPSYGELLFLYNNINNIQSTFPSISIVKKVDFSANYWTSTQIKNTDALYIGNKYEFDNMAYYSKSSLYQVRCFSYF